MSTNNKNLIALQFYTSGDFKYNLDHLESLIEQTPEDSIILAPEVCVTGFCYERMAEANEFAPEIKERIQSLSTDRTIAFTCIEYDEEMQGYKNVFYCYGNGKLIHRQAKLKLFPLGNEHEHFISGSEEEIIPFGIDGITCACLICFELRFSDLWQKVLGAELILVPAQWGAPRKEHFETLTKALAIANQAFVLASDGANEEMAKSSGIIEPFGKELRDDSKEIITLQADLGEIKKMRRYINIGL